MKQLLISSDPFITKAAKTENKKLSVFILRKKTDLAIVGNVYKGVVNNISQSLNAAFIDIGMDKNAFLCIDKMCTNGLSTQNKNLKVGDEVVVQVFKPIVSTKGPKVTTNITIPGNFLVLLRNNNFIGISKHIESPKRTEELKAFLEKFSTNDIGFIARTASKFASWDDLEKEIDYLKKTNDFINKLLKIKDSPSLIYEEPQLPIKVIREYCDTLTDEVIIDDPQMHKSAKHYLSQMGNKCGKKLKLYNFKEPIFKHFGIEDEIKKLESSTITLKSGGYIIIEKTEALFAIDVNSGKYNYDVEMDNAIFEINKEAAYEIFNQIALRDIGGLIVVDFIDMENSAHKNELESILKYLAEKDRRKTHVNRISEFGLVEISRRKSDNDIFDEMFDKCDGCLNNGLVKGLALVCSEIYEQIRYSDNKSFKLSATASVVEYMKERIGSFNKRLSYNIITGCNTEDYNLEVIK
jgi:ribonuclease G